MLTPDAAAVAQHRLLQQKVVDEATRDLQQFWGALDLTRPEAARDTLITFTDHLVDAYGDVAGTLAADFYDEARALAGASGTFRATVQGADTAAAQGATRRLAGHLWTDNPAGMLPGMSAVVDRLVKGAGRSTIIQAAGREKIRFARVPQGATCPFCLMLGSRGFVYRDSHAAGEHNDFHANCDCVVVPSWDRKNPHLDGYDPAELLDQWEETNPDRDRLARSAQRAKDRHRDATNARARSDYAERRQAAGMPYKPRSAGPSGSGAGGPAGRLHVPPGLRVQAHERATADRLAGLGHEVEFRVPVNVPGVKNPDILLDGQVWEMKAPQGAGKTTIDNQLHRAGKQAPRLVLDLARTPLDDDVAIAEVQRRIVERVHLDSVLVLRKDGSAVRIDRL